MTCIRRYREASAWGSSRVLMRGRVREVEVLAASQIWSARCENEYEGMPVVACGSVEPGKGPPWGWVFPAPTRI